eukprot:NODE_96_length_2481_cov_330.598684_g76_i0.p1 GENE.NODE_96_length_2481_cov_330.598684_g76_i0~~NODE_96_length_2481_cov_330.598684_g76_i0.p1  ORF type:complete len:609 (-),score=106.13 NODE_96_length_2481_cov_330.598684_g76_i0:601-2427(-)
MKLVVFALVFLISANANTILNNYVNPCKVNNHHGGSEEPKKDYPKWCENYNATIGNAVSIFDGATVEEIVALMEFFKTWDSNMRFDGTESGPYNYIYAVDPLYPAKAAALAYLDSNGPRPQRYLKVTVNRGAANPPDIMVYKVGPFPGALTISEMIAPGEVPYEARGRDSKELNALRRVIVEPEMAILRPLLEESFGGLYWGNGLDFHATAPPGYLGRDREERCFLTIEFPGTSRVKDIHVIPVTFRVSAAGSNPATWRSYDYYYARQGPFPTAQALLTAYNTGAITKFSFPPSHVDDVRKWTTPKRPVDTRWRSPIPPPKQAPSQPRFTIDGSTVAWEGWQFHVTSVQRRGPTWHDIRYRGQRIAYEVSIQEITLIYSANDPVQSNVAYFDTTFGNGETQDVIPGIDCPEHAQYIANTWYSGGPSNHPRAICIFEEATGHPLWRKKDGNASGVPETNLVARFAIPVGHYDYFVEMKFRLDGAIHVTYSATGGIQSYFWLPGDPTEDDFGTRFFTHSMGALHDHTFGWKLDLDILGTENNFVVNEFKQAHPDDVPMWAATGGKPSFVTDVYDAPDMIRYIQRTMQKTEEGYKMDLSKPKRVLCSGRHK